MPKLQDYREAHYDHTSKVSDNVRALSISAIGIIWIFKVQVGDGYQIPEELYFPVLLVFVAMALDFAQYIYSSIAWHYFFRSKEKDNVSEDEEIFAPPVINLLSYVFFYVKVLMICFAYYFIINFLISIVNWS